MSWMRTLLAVAVLISISPTSSWAQEHNGVYVVSTCRAGGMPAGVAGWTHHLSSRPTIVQAPAPREAVFDDCATGGPFGMALGTFSSEQETVSRWTFAAPTHTSITAFRLWRGGSSPTQEEPWFYVLVDGTSAQPEWSAPPRDPLALDSVVKAFTDLDARSVGFQLHCRPNQCAVPAVFEAHKAEIELKDASAPVIENSELRRLASTPVASDIDVRIGFGDLGGGVRKAILLVDGQIVDESTLGDRHCVPPFAVPVPCPRSGSATLRVPVVSLSDGAHSVSVAVVDVAGNRTSTAPLTFHVQRPVPPAPPEPPAAPAPLFGGTITAGFGSGYASSTRASYERPPTLRGVLVNADGAPVADAAVAWTSRVAAPGARPLPGPGLRTDRLGRFSLKLPRGPSREIQLQYGGVSRSVRVVVRAPVRLRTNVATVRNGSRVRFIGTIPEAGDARTRVELQAWAGRWVPFATTSVRNGRFAASYRFTSTFSTTRYSFRAVTHGDESFPYAAGSSSTVKVLVRP